MSPIVRLSDRVLDIMMMLTLTAALALAARHLAIFAEMHVAMQNLCAVRAASPTCRLLCWMAGR
jgi:hypothetical protein